MMPTRCIMKLRCTAMFIWGAPGQANAPQQARLMDWVLHQGRRTRNQCQGSLLQGRRLLAREAPPARIGARCGQAREAGVVVGLPHDALAAGPRVPAGPDGVHARVALGRVGSRASQAELAPLRSVKSSSGALREGVTARSMVHRQFSVDFHAALPRSHPGVDSGRPDAGGALGHLLAAARHGRAVLVAGPARRAHGHAVLTACGQGVQLGMQEGEALVLASSPHSLCVSRTEACHRSPVTTSALAERVAHFVQSGLVVGHTRPLAARVTAKQS